MTRERASGEGGLQLSQTVLIALWCHPRSRSTALERAMMERGDLRVVHEPFSYLYYVDQRRGSAPHLDLDPERPQSYAAIRAELLALAREQPVFVKDMAYHCVDDLLLDEELLRVARHVFLIRDPAQAIASYYAIDPHCALEEMGIEQLCRLFRRVEEIKARRPLVINAESLASSPDVTLSRLYESVGLSNRNGAATWEPGHRREWDSWREWHRDAAESSGIHARSTSYEQTVDNNEVLRGYYEHHLPFFRELERYAI